MSQTSQFGENFGDTFGSPRFDSVATLIDDVLTSTNKTTTNADDRLLVLRMVNHRYLQIVGGRQWRFLRRESVIDFYSPYNQGYLTVTEGEHKAVEDIDAQNIINGIYSIADFTATMVGQRIILGANSTLGAHQADYRINKIVSPKELELTTKFTGPSLSDARFTILFDRYFLEEQIAEINSIVLQSHGEMIGLTQQEFRQKQESNPSLSGIPRNV